VDPFSGGLKAPGLGDLDPDTSDDFREISDTRKMRSWTYDNALAAVAGDTATSNDKFTLRITNPRYVDPEKYSRREQKSAMLGGRTLGRRIKGTWELVDNLSGSVVDKKDAIVARVPFITQRGTVVYNGVDYGIGSQYRLLPGVYARRKNNGELEAHANVKSGTGPAHRYHLDPESGVFKLEIGQAQLPLLPLLRAAHVDDKTLESVWGKELLAANRKYDDPQYLRKYYGKFLRKLDEDDDKNKAALVETFKKMKLDPYVTQRTLGQPFEGLDSAAVLATTKKLLAVSKGEADTDDRDSLAYKQFLFPEELFAERITKDYDGVRRNLLWKATRQGNLQWLPSGALTPQLDSVLLKSGLAQPMEEVNTSELLDKLTRTTAMGEGGVGDTLAIPDSAREVHPSQIGFLDLIRTPESERAGVDLYFASGARKGKDGKVYAKFLDAKTGKHAWKTPQDLAEARIAYADAVEQWRSKRIPGIKANKPTWIRRKELDYIVDQNEETFSPLANLIGGKSGSKGQRGAMGSRMTTQALPLVASEAPLVQGLHPTKNESYDKLLGGRLGAVVAHKPGKVVKVDGDGVHVQYDDGETETHELYDNFVHNRRTFIHQTPVAQVGQRFNPGDVLAKSNFTNDRGEFAVGLNARVAYIPWGGKNWEDAYAISESFKKKLTSEHAYQHELRLDDDVKTEKRHFQSVLPGKFDRTLLETIGDDGIIKVGTEVKYGDPLVLAAKKQAPGGFKVHRKNAVGWSDSTLTWDHKDPGVVVDVGHGRDGPVVVVKSKSEMQTGDKISGRFGDKGIVHIIPDRLMPKDKDGNPFDVLANPAGLPTRTNPIQTVESILGKIAAKTGQVYGIRDFDGRTDLERFARDEAKKHNVPVLETIIDPEKNLAIPNVQTGVRYFMKLYHQAEHKEQGRGGGSYSADETPTKGGFGGAKRLGNLDMAAMLAHGAVAGLRDATVVRGQKNDPYWLEFMQGVTPREPKVPLVYQKFLSQLKAAGVNVVPRGKQLQLMAMTDRDVRELAGDRTLANADTVSFDKDLSPVPGGLFDPKLTGAHRGNQWSKIDLDEPLPNPAFEEPVRRLLGLTQAKFRAVIAGEEKLGEATGPRALADALGKLDLDKEISFARNEMAGKNMAKRDAAIRRLGYLTALKATGRTPGDLVMRHVPVLPPLYRPIASLGPGSAPVVADPNYLYRELFDADSNLRKMKKIVGDDGIGVERLAVYDAFKAVTGLGDPIGKKTQARGVKGILKSVFGSSPKHGSLQRKLLSSTVDQVGRAVIAPDPDLDMDEVGLPEDSAYEVYGKYVARRMRRMGMPLTQALQELEKKTPLARRMLDEEMEDRPVYVNRAPVWHKFGIMAYRPRLVKGSTLMLNPLVYKGKGADNDGDAVQFHAPADEAAVKEAWEKLPSRNLFAVSDFKTPMHAPTNEHVYGLWKATTAKSKRRPRLFATTQDLLNAYRNGEIAYDDQVEVLGA
jgi:DNA-directed RNA polymerase subunit beta